MLRYLIVCLPLLLLLNVGKSQSFTDGPIVPQVDNARVARTGGGSLPPNERANELYSLGKSFMARGQFAQAVRAFESIRQFEFNQISTAAIFLAGQSYFYLGDAFMASKRFDEIIFQYSESRYLDDAIYHKALLQLKDYREENVRQGLNDLFFLISRSPRMDIVEDARESLRAHLFYELPGAAVEQYYQYAPYAFRPMFVDAICYRWVQAGRENEARNFYNNFVMQGGPESPFLLRLFNEQEVLHYYEPNVMKIGLFLPLFLNESLGGELKEMPARSRVALEFYEGFQKAVADYEPYARKKIFLKVFDTQRDSSQLATQLNQIDAFYPDLVVGEVFNPQSRQISDWSERRAIPQVVPFSPTLSLENKYQMLLVHSAVTTHARRMAEYARYKLQLNRVAVWTDGRYLTDQLARTFSQAFDTLGGEVVLVPIDSNFNNAKQQILDNVRNLQNKPIDGYYVPLPSEESCGLILSEMQYLKIPARVMGAPAWGSFTAIERELLERYQVTYTTSYFKHSDSTQYQAFFNEFLRQFGAPPSMYNVQGYDLGMFLLQLLDQFDYSNGQTLTDYIKNYGIHRGIHQDLYFSNQPDNQLLHIMQYRPGGEVKVNRF